MALRTFEPGKRLYRGNLHTHTTASDGLKSPAEALEWYARQGYDFVAFTDHWEPPPPDRREGILTIPGVELHAIDPCLGMFHIVGLGVGCCPDKSAIVTADDAGRFVRSHGGLAMLCHPYWCGMTSAAVGQVAGEFVLDIYNSTCHLHISKGLSTVHWDDVLARGMRVWGVAVDDTHWRGDEGGGWVMVQADELSVPAVLAALAQGRFYATSGPAIEDFRVDEGKAYARTSEARRIAFLCDNSNGRVSVAGSGQADITEAEFMLPPGITYVRLEADDARGKRAWSNPIYL